MPDYLPAIIVAVGASVLICLVAYAARALRVWSRLRSERLVTCPETGRPAAVRIDVAHAALTDLRDGDAELRLSSCSRWATRGRCDEPCLFEAQERDSKVTTIVADWYAGKKCIYCGTAVRDDHVAGHRAAFLGIDGSTHEWSDVPPESLQDSLRSGWPVCWNCHVVETFRRMHPQLVTDRTNVPRTT